MLGTNISEARDTVNISREIFPFYPNEHIYIYIYIKNNSIRIVGIINTTHISAIINATHISALRVAEHKIKHKVTNTERGLSAWSLRHESLRFILICFIFMKYQRHTKNIEFTVNSITF